MSKKRHIKNIFKTKNPITHGMPNTELPITVYSLIGKTTFVNLFVKLTINNIATPKKAFNNKNLKGFLLLTEIIIIYKNPIINTIKAAYFKKFITSPFYKYEFFKTKILNLNKNAATNKSETAF